MIGVVLILASTFAYNGSAVFLSVAMRRKPKGSDQLVALGQSRSGVYGVASNLLGWVLEVFALTMLPLTLARILNVSGLAFLLGLTRLVLKERIGRREIFGTLLIAVGIVTASFESPHFSNVQPSFGQWTVLFAIMLPGIAFPYVLRIFRKKARAIPAATSAGLAYAFTGILNKGAAHALDPFAFSSLAIFTACIAVIGVVGFYTELTALGSGSASVVVPIVLALHTVVPVICAPVLFGEVWPASILLRVLLGGGIMLATGGIVVLAGSSSGILSRVQ